jgi:predicted nucleic acid-binding protein
VKYLVDANVLSEATRPRPAAAVVEWLRDNAAEIVVNPIILGELQYGILVLPVGKRRTRLEQWFAGGSKGLDVLELDADTAAVWARLLAELKRKGRAMSVKDSLIAATARQYRLTVVTRNTTDFQHAGVTTFNPFG